MWVYYLSFKINFRFQLKKCDDCHDMTQKTTSFDDFEIVAVGKNDYKILFWFMDKMKQHAEWTILTLVKKVDEFKRNILCYSNGK